MTPGKYDLNLYRGDTYRWTFRLWADEGKTQPVDLTGATVKSEIREKTGGISISEIVCTLGGPGEILAELDPAAFATIPASGVWDLQVTFPDGTVRSMLAGKVTTTGDVTDSTAPTIRERLRSA